ncbi:MAG TPA: dephospho-CoA kinase [Chitinophagaceae bacterium]|nr:dephospho-CoA kinase [Chitinophagaceae bacterium]
MKIIGVTGGIGSGKTTVCKMFETLRIPVYYADERAKMLMQHDSKVKQDIKNLLGEEAYDSNDGLNKAFIVKQIFGNAEMNKSLNAIVHPATIQDSIKWADNQSAPFVLKETALMFETEAFHYVDMVIGVFAPKVMRIHRTMERNHISRQEVLQRMEKQMEEGIKMKLCDWVITNDEQQPLIPQVLNLYKKILDTSSSK